MFVIGIIYKIIAHITNMHVEIVDTYIPVLIQYIHDYILIYSCKRSNLRMEFTVI